MKIIKQLCICCEVKRDGPEGYRSHLEAACSYTSHATGVSEHRAGTLFVRGRTAEKPLRDQIQRHIPPSLAYESDAVGREAAMAKLFLGFHGAAPDTGFLRLAEVFHLEDQLTPIPTEPRTESHTAS